MTVTDAAGRETEGKIAALSASRLELIVNGGRRDFAELDLETISRRDSRWNGTLWGLAVGAVLGASFEKSLVAEYGRDDIGYGSAVMPFAGFGAGIGFAADAMIKGRRVIYAKSRTTARTLRAAAAWNTSRKGVFVSLRF